MGTKDSRVDTYIERAAAFAQPILHHIRSVVHAACPEVTETIKWSFPHFQYKGMLCSMAAFKEHCAFGFWHTQMKADGVAVAKSDAKTSVNASAAMGQMGRIEKLSDLPREALFKQLVRKAAALNDAGVSPRRVGPPRNVKPVVVPVDLRQALDANPKALATFSGFSPTNKREYVDWIVEAKRDETRRRRLATAIEWMAQGKIKEWKYVRT